MQDTRQQILEILKRDKEVTVQDLSQQLGLTSVTVRHHLEILRAEGYITEPEVQRSNRPGRPRYIYQLTSTAADLFPNNYSGLTNALLDALEARLPSQEYEDLLEDVAHRMVEKAGRLPSDPRDRVERITDFLNRQGFVARWEEESDERFFITISNCPYHYVAQNHNEVCHIDEVILRSLTGGELSPKKREAYKGGLCRYEIIWSEDAKK
jgi:predicted ArsR family transcriptional regulator